MMSEKYPWLCSTTDTAFQCSYSGTNNIVSEQEANDAETLTTDAYGKYGLKLTYYKLSLDTSRDSVYGEDPLQIIERSFYFNGYTNEIPPNVRTYQLQGIYGEDLVQIYVGKTAFKYWSTYGGETKNVPEVFDDVEPRIGDLIYFDPNDTFYEVRDVKYFSEPFGLMSHTYTITLKVLKNAKYTIDTTNETLKNTSDPIYTIASPTLESSTPYDELRLNDDLKSLSASENVNMMDVLWKDDHKNDKRFDPFDGWN